MLRSRIALLMLLSCVPSAAGADELGALVREYHQAMGKIGGNPKDRPQKVKQHVAPIIAKIGRLDSAGSLAWLAGELDKERIVPEVRAAMPSAILASSSADAVKLLLRGFSRRPLPVQSATLEAIRDAKKALDLQEVKFLVSQLGGGERSSRGDRDGSLLPAAVEVLKRTEDPAAREWLAREAFSAAGGDGGRLFILARVAGELRLTGARDELVRLVGSRSPLVAGAAIEALARLGVGEAASEIAMALERGRSDTNLRIKALDTLARAGESGLAVVIDAARGKDPELRAIAMGSLALAPASEEAMAALCGGLQDPETTVRSAALRALSGVRVKGMVPALIGALGSQEDPSFRVRVLDLLVRVSGQNMGLVAADWEKWWREVAGRFEFPKEENEGFTKVTQYDLSYFGIEVSSKRLGFVVDISSSMREKVPVKKGGLSGGDDDGPGSTGVAPDPEKGGGGKSGGTEMAMKIDVLKRELVRLLKKLSPDTYLNIICFDGQYQSWQKQLQPMAGSGRGRAIKYVEELNTGSGTNVFDTLEFTLQDKRVDTIYLLTDGLPSRGRFTDAESILREIQVLNRVRGVTIHTIAFGAESEFLKELARQNGGRYRFVDRY